MTAKRKRQFGVKELEQGYEELTLARFLRSWRLSENLSQVEFAKAIGISAQNLNDMENGRKGVSIEKAFTIAENIGYSLYSFMTHLFCVCGSVPKTTILNCSP